MAYGLDKLIGSSGLYSINQNNLVLFHLYLYDETYSYPDIALESN